ncbi:thiopeptide-type bacteriocin biosynthesis protein [Nakamurella flavida]|uniref:Thiopeptide-type bacteriocin biosynthesis protein n=1 Tax=Nakamurella flavida TaxID=363630 RepID=A0A939C5M0_9ACTN|nr:thiopeptide-type bacteriocin biosynthesis protein [Nakamurella flavida]MBM9476327.1 thiopeptide-type bacteriocin biosynthesis protein [Nakamurella flavida]MDP9779572.1 hypothetical protein [Nakamurella flavida]
MAEVVGRRPAPGASPPPPDAVATATDWLYLRIGLTALAETETVLRDRVGPWVDRHRPAGWFFLRYLDAGGPHLRLRVHGAAGTAAGTELIDRLRDAEPGAPPREVVERLHTPEYGKFGGPAGVALAERLSVLGTRTAMDLLAHRADVPTRTLGALHLRAVTAGLPAGQRQGFLYSYAWYWSGRGRLGPGGPPGAAFATAAPRGSLTAELDAAAARPGIGPIIRAHAAAFWAEIDRADPARWGHSRWLTLHHHLHLQDNRLGLLPSQEAAVARSLWREGAPGADRPGADQPKTVALRSTGVMAPEAISVA